MYYLKSNPLVKKSKEPTMTWLTVTTYMVTNEHRYVPFVVITIPSVPHALTPGLLKE